MKFIIAPDKFKGSLSSAEACEAIKAGILSLLPDAEVIVMPMADGGDGLLQALSAYSNYTTRKVLVHDPLFRPTDASYLITGDNVAFIEMARASGLLLLKAEERNPAITSSFGTGELIRSAIKSGATKIILGIGGSATNDGGIGMAAALGYKFRDAAGNELQPTGENLTKIASIDKRQLIDMKNVSIEVACDVTNRLTGPEGAASIFAAQKGADKEMILQLDQGLTHLARIIKNEFGIEVEGVPGAGAAGGLGAGAIAFLGARLIPGVNLMLEYSHAEEQIASADLVFSGEGKLDIQSLHGKVVSGISSLCRKYQKPLIVLCGKNELTSKELETGGISNAFSILEFASDTAEASREASRWLQTITMKAIENCTS